jgi:hypothetical protein
MEVDFLIVLDIVSRNSGFPCKKCPRECSHVTKALLPFWVFVLRDKTRVAFRRQYKMRYLTILMLMLAFALTTVSTTVLAGISAADQDMVYAEGKKKKKGAGEEEPECD